MTKWWIYHIMMCTKCTKMCNCSLDMYHRTGQYGQCFILIPRQRLSQKLIYTFALQTINVFMAMLLQNQLEMIIYTPTTPGTMVYPPNREIVRPIRKCIFFGTKCGVLSNHMVWMVWLVKTQLEWRKYFFHTN